VTDDEGLLEIEITESDGRRTIRPRGEIDIHTCGRLERAFTEGTGDVVLDLGEVTFIDSSGLRALLIGRDAVSNAGGEFELVNPSTVVRRLLQITGLEEKFGLQN
jgi:anti-sigma B factor antagonist